MAENSIESIGTRISALNIDGEKYLVGLTDEEYKKVSQIISEQEKYKNNENKREATIFGGSYEDGETTVVIGEAESYDGQEKERQSKETSRNDAEAKRDAQEKSRIDKENARNDAEEIRIKNANELIKFVKNISLKPEEATNSVYKQCIFKIPNTSIIGEDDDNTTLQEFSVAKGEDGTIEYTTTTMAFPYVTRPSFNENNSEEEILVGKTPNGEDIYCKHICSNFSAIGSLNPKAGNCSAFSSPSYAIMAKGEIAAQKVSTWLSIEVENVKEVLDARYFYFYTDFTIDALQKATNNTNKNSYTVMEKTSWIKYNLSSENKLTIKIHLENDKLAANRWRCYGLEALVYYTKYPSTNT